MPADIDLSKADAGELREWLAEHYRELVSPATSKRIAYAIKRIGDLTGLDPDRIIRRAIADARDRELAEDTITYSPKWGPNAGQSFTHRRVSE